MDGESRGDLRFNIAKCIVGNGDRGIPEQEKSSMCLSIETFRRRGEHT